MVNFPSFKPSKRYGHEIVIQSNNEGGKGITEQSSTSSKSCEQNSVATLNAIENVRHNVKGEGKHSEL